MKPGAKKKPADEKVIGITLYLKTKRIKELGCNDNLVEARKECRKLGLEAFNLMQIDAAD